MGPKSLGQKVSSVQQKALCASWKGLTSKVDDKEPDHDNCCPSSRLVIVKVVDVLGEDHSDNEVAQGHAKGTDGQNGLTTDTVNPENGRDCGDKHGNADDSRCQKTMLPISIFG
jgi:hypothetical protein